MGPKDCGNLPLPVFNTTLEWWMSSNNGTGLLALGSGGNSDYLDRALSLSRCTGIPSNELAETFRSAPCRREAVLAKRSTYILVQPGH